MSAVQRETLLLLFLDESSPSVNCEWFQANGCNRNLDSFIPKSFVCCNESLTRHFQVLLSVTLEVAPSPSRWTCELILKHLATGPFSLLWSAGLIWFLLSDVLDSPFVHSFGGASASTEDVAKSHKKGEDESNKAMGETTLENIPVYFFFLLLRFLIW